MTTNYKPRPFKKYIDEILKGFLVTAIFHLIISLKPARIFMNMKCFFFIDENKQSIRKL